VIDLIDPRDPLERQNAKLRTIVTTLMRRLEQDADTPVAAYDLFQRAVTLEQEVKLRTRELERALDLLNESNTRLSQARADAEIARTNLANAIETVQEGFAMFDADERMVLCNSRFGKHMHDIHHLFEPGLQFGDYVRLVANSPYLSLPAGETPEGWAAYRLARHQDEHAVFNARMAGSRWLQVSEHRTSDGGTVVLQTDITDLMRHEREERERLLDDQARLIKATLEHLDQGICIFDAQNLLAGWNGRAGELLNIRAARFRLGTPFTKLYDLIRDAVRFTGRLGPEDVEAWVRKGARAAPLYFEIELGRSRTLAVFSQRLPDGGFVMSFSDVSAERAAVKTMSRVNETLERRVTERTLELEDALGEAERANASKSRFVAAASHDLLQPLSAAKLYVGGLVDTIETPELRARLTKAGNALNSVERILDALLDISKLDSGLAAVDVTTIHLGDLIAQLADELRPVAERRGLDLRVVATNAAVKSDSTYLRRILQNLAMNAIRYTDTGKVLIGVRRHAGHVRIQVCDTGPGIPEDQHEKIFMEFQRLDASANPSDGMGLGLAIVERACRLLQHPLHLRSIPGRGTCFAIDVPRGPAMSHAVVENRESENATLDHQIAILIENDADVRSALAIALEGWGLDVLPCCDLADAESVLDEIDIGPDIIIVDYQLDQGALGTDAIVSLRAVHGPVPACIISATRCPDLTLACNRLGAGLLHKPIDLDALRGRIEAALATMPASGDLSGAVSTQMADDPGS
jgi:signal transduction histidine kinase/CheY-like chemotaxis protein